MTRDYPLQAAVLDRHAKRTRREAELAAALRAQAEAERASGAALEAANAHRARRPLVEGAAGTDSASGRELKRSAAFARRHAQEAERLREAHAATVTREVAARAAVATARAALASAYADEQVLDRDRERFTAEDRRKARAAEQDELDEQRASQRPRPR